MIARRRFLTLSACALTAPLAARAATTQIWRGTAMGAEVTLRLSTASARHANEFFRRVETELARIERLFSLYRESDLTRLNRSGILRHPTEGMVELFALSDRLHEATGGAFDPSVQPLWLARATGADQNRARGSCGWHNVVWGHDEIRLTRPGMALTFNGIAQGWTADRLAHTAAGMDLGDLLIDTGELRAAGPRGWDAGIADPEGRIVQRLVLRERGLATSSPLGTRIGPGRDLAHILDIRADHGPRHSTVSVSAPTAALADGLSTAFCLMPRPEIDTALTAFPGCRLEGLRG